MSKRKLPLPLESANWVLITKALELHIQHTGADDKLAGSDFNQALKAGRLRSRVRRADGQLELLAVPAWEDLYVATLVRLSDLRFKPSPQDLPQLAVFSHQLGKRPPGCWFYVWLPDYKNIFGDLEPQPQSAEQVSKTPRKRGRKADHPWPAIGVELVRRVSKKMKFPARPSTNSLATELSGWCEERYGKAPADSDLRAFIDGVLDALRMPRA